MLQRNSINKNETGSNRDNKSLEKGRCYLVKGPKPLQKFRFYLDVKNFSTTTKLEQKIKDLGGAVEYFLVREVTHVISDREINLNNSVDFSPKTPNNSVETNYESPKPSTSTPKAGQSRLKTRADAMLEKVCSKPQTGIADPLKNAKLWNIPIWTVNKVYSWLEKVSANISLLRSASKEKSTSKSSSSVRELTLNSPFIKFEPVSRDARPVYKSLDSWPILDVDGRLGSCPFKMKPKPENENEIDTKMPRRNKPRLSVRGLKESESEKPHSAEKILNGYCEICHLEYRELQEHLQSETHQQFVKNDSNYLTLDSLIDESTNVDAFLRINGGTICKDGLRRSLRVGRSPNGKYNGLDDDRPMTRGRTNYNKRFSNLSALSPTGSEASHQLRSNKSNLNSPTNNSLVGDDEILALKSNRKNSRSSEEDLNHLKEKSEFPEHGKSKKTCIKTKRISADERLVSDNKTYYKVEVMTTKLRSSGLGAHCDHSTAKNQSPIPEETDCQEPSSLVVKFKKVRRSELETLNDEAENFMFPRKDGSSFGDIGTDEGPNTTYSPQKDQTLEIPSSDFETTMKTPKNKEHFDHNEEFLEKIYLKNIKSLLKEKKSDDLEETPGKRKTRKVIDYQEENSESETAMKTRPKKPINYLEPKIIDENSDSNSLIKTRPKKSINYLEESSIDEESVTPACTPKKIQQNNTISASAKITATEENAENDIDEVEVAEVEADEPTVNSRPPRRKYVMKSTYKIKRSYKIQKKSLPQVQKTNMKIVKKRFNPIANLKSHLNHKKQKFTKRKFPSSKNICNKKSEVIPELTDETAQDGTELVEIKRRGRKRKSEINQAVNITPGPNEELDISKDASRDSTSLCDSVKRRKKHYELFIEENQKYFKFESPSSRLRYQGSIFSSIKSPPRVNGEQEEGEEVNNKERPEFHLDEVKYFFEMEPKSEPWYQTFVRQDRGEERYTSLSDPGYHTRLILPYQLPATFIPLDPQVCISHYDRIKKYIINPESEESDIKSEPSDESSQNQNQPNQTQPNQPNLTEKEKDKEKTTTEKLEKTLQKEKHSINSTESHQPNEPKPKLKYNPRRKKRFNMKVQNHPRKSPRQHASTLAILSSLINQRKKRERKSGGESDLSRSSLGTISEENSPEKEKDKSKEKNVPDNSPVNSAMRETVKMEKEKDTKTETDQNISEKISEAYDENNVIRDLEALKCVSEILTAPIELDISGEVDGIVLKDAPDAIELIESYTEYDCTNELPLPGINDRSTVKRKCKKKRNATGWPTKKRLFPRKVNKNGENISLEDQTGLSEASLELNNSEKCSEYSNSDLENRTNGDLIDSNCNVSENNCVNNLKQGLSLPIPLPKLNNTNSTTDNNFVSSREILALSLNKYDKHILTNLYNNKACKSRLRSSSSPDRKPLSKKLKIQENSNNSNSKNQSSPVSPRSPRKLRAPRGKWYRER